MKTQREDPFWRWFGIFFAVGIVTCVALVIILIEFPTIELEASAAEATPAPLAESWWVVPPYYPAFHPW